ncbi:MAG: hypothetical protein AABY22_23600, partial [Nanoarchaeota archaeon]
QFYTIAFTWIKQNKKADSLFWGMGNATRANPEYVLLGRKGKLKVGDTYENYDGQKMLVSKIHKNGLVK